MCQIQSAEPQALVDAFARASGGVLPTTRVPPTTGCLPLVQKVAHFQATHGRLTASRVA